MISAVVLDLVVLTALGIAITRGYGHGSVREFFSLVGLATGVLAAPALVGPMTPSIQGITSADVNLARVIALAIVIGTCSLIGAVVGIRTAGVDIPGPRVLDGVGGIIFAVMRSVTVISLILYGTLAVSTGEQTRTFTSSVEDSVSGQLFSDPDSPFTIFYDGMLSRSDDLRALTLWVRQRSAFQEEVPTDRLDFAATNERLTPALDAERQMLQLVNEERLQKDVDSLTWCERCAIVARSHSKDMYRNGYFSHVDSNGDDPFDRLRDARIPYDAAGENLSVAPTINKAHQGLMESPDHRENILRELFDEVGIGCLKGPYGLMCTQVFRRTV